MKTTSIRRAKGRVGLILLACLMAMASIKSAAFAQAAERTVTILEARGDASVRTAGGFASYPAYAGMKLHDGDTIATGAGAYVIVQVDDRKDEITLGENGELHLSDLKAQGKAAVSRFTLLSGSIWTHVEKRTSGFEQGERFEIQTPTAVMSAKGTHFWAFSNPLTGQTTILVASGIVRASTVTANESEQTKAPLQESKFLAVYPAQQIILDSRTQAEDLKVKVDLADIGKMVNQAPPKVIESLIKNAVDIQQENEQMREHLRKLLEEGVTRPVESTLLIKDAADLNKVTANFEHLIPNIAKQAVDAHKIEQKVIDEANKKMDDPLKKIDLAKVEPLDKTAGLDPEVEAAKQAAQEAVNRYAEEQRQLLENQQRLAALLQKIETNKKTIDEANRIAAEEAARKAAEQLKAQLTEAERKTYEENKRRNEQSTRPTGDSQQPATGSPSPGPPPSNTDQSETLVLREAVSDGKTVTANLYLSGFDQPDESIYAVEVHLLYDSSRLSYHGKSILTKSSGAVFGVLPGSLEIVRQPSAWGDEANLYYAAVSDSSGTDGSPLLVTGEKLLASIPLKLLNANDEDLVIKLVYFKVLDKDGNIVLDGSDLPAPIEVSVQSAAGSR